MATVKVTDESFDADVLKSSTPVRVDFWAEWCGPCKQIGPALEQIADELGGKVTVAKINIDDSPMTPSKLGVKGIPTLMLFKDGQMTSMKVGAMPKGQIVGDLFQGRADLFAGAAPLRPEVDEHGRGGLQHVGVETVVGDLDRGHGGYLLRGGVGAPGVMLAEMWGDSGRNQRSPSGASVRKSGFPEAGRSRLPTHCSPPRLM